MKHILVATDFSQRAEKALGRALLLATEHRAALDILHVVTPSSVDALCDLLPDSRHVVEEKLVNSFFSQLYDFVDRLEPKPPITIRPRVKVAEIVACIIESAESCNADIVVLGSHGEHSANALFVGTTAETVLAGGMRPVLIVKQEATAPYGKIGVPVDFTERSAAAIRKAGELAPDAMTCLLHAFQVPNPGLLRRLGVPEAKIKHYRTDLYEHATREIDKLAAERQNDRITRVVEMDHPTAMILRWTEKLHFDLIVMGKHGGRLGSVIRYVLHNSACDVMIA